jgi:two-component system chemotaxis sensor kinase CheA
MSTTDEANEVSGRGIGLDIVRANVEQLNGTVNINTRFSQGTVFTIQLPTTAALLQGFIVTSNNSICVIPQLPVIETLRIRTKDLKSIRGQDFIKINQQRIPVFNINNLYGYTGNGHSMKKEHVHIITVRVGATVAGIVCDELMTQQEFIISPQRTESDDLTSSETTILEDGQTALILNIPSFIRTSLLRRMEGQKIRC